ncbi:MAG: hypothetical protein RL272_1045 [Candidatus Parcubacteria bacterium]
MPKKPTAKKGAARPGDDIKGLLGQVFFGGSSIGFAAGDPESGRFIAANKTFCRWTGYTEKELLTRSVGSLGDPAQLTELKEKLRRLLSGEIPSFTVERRYIRKDGTTFLARTTLGLASRTPGQRVFVQAIVEDITEKKRLEDELVNRKELLRILIENTPAAVAMFDRDMKYIAYSRRFLSDYNLGEQDLAGRSHYEVFPEIPERWKEIHRRCLAGAIEKNDNDPFVRRDGGTDWIRWEIRPWNDPSGGIGGVILFSEVITEQKRQADALRESARRMGLVVKNFPGIIYQANLDSGGTELFDGMVEGITGYPPEHFRGSQSKWIDIIHPEDRSRVRQAAERLPVEPGGEIKATFRVVRKDGGIRWIKDTSRVIKTDAGRILQGILYDATDEVEAESKLKESEEKFASAFAASPTFMGITKRDGTFVDVNEAFCRTFGYSRQELLGKSVVTVGLMGEGRVRSDLAALERMGGAMKDVEAEIRAKDGSPRWINYSVNIIRIGGEPLFVSTGFDITERRILEKQREDDLSEIRRLYDRAPSGYQSVDRNGLVLRMNDTELRWLGYSREEVVGRMNFADFLDAGGREFFRNTHLPALLKGGMVEGVKYVLTRKDGSTFTVALRATAVTDGRGAFLMSDAVIVDISEIEKADEARIESEKKYRAMFETSNDAIMLLGADKFFDCNEATLKVFGCKTREEFLGKHPGDVSPPLQDDGRESRVAADERIKTAFKEGRNFFEWTHRRADGTDFPAEVLLTPMDYRGETVLQATVRDITERKNLEKERWAAQERITELVKNVPVGLFRNTPGKEGHFLEVNPAFLAIFEADSREQMLKYNTSDLYRDPAFRASISDKIMKQGYIRDEIIPLKTLKNRPIWGKVSSILKKDAAGNSFFDGIVEDVTTLKLAEERARELDALKSKFIQVVSHQLRTPLNAIRWSLEELLSRKGGNLDAAQGELLRMAYAADQDVIARIHDLLLALDIEEGRLMRLETEEIHVEDLVRSVLAEVAGRLSAGGLALTFDAPPDQLTTINVDPERIRDVIRRLLDNAISYSRAGGSIACRVIRVDGAVRVEVADTGIGIPKAEHGHLFRRFHRASNASVAKPDASGLALYISSNIIKAHGGRIGFTSEEGKGSTFWFELPMVQH